MPLLKPFNFNITSCSTSRLPCKRINPVFEGVDLGSTNFLDGKNQALEQHLKEQTLLTHA